MDTVQMNGQALGHVVKVKNGPGGVRGLALVQSYADFPTFGLVDPSGYEYDWAAHLCAPASPDEAAAYWRQRAEIAEAKLGAPNRPAFAPYPPPGRWPLGINPEMDRHAAAKGLAHWSCVSPKSNAWWVRRDGHEIEATFRGARGYLDDLAQYDEAWPMEPETTPAPNERAEPRQR